MTLQEFISEHAGDDTTKLLLGKAKWPEIDMDKAVTIIECRRKIRMKLPGWYEHTGIDYPDKLCTEQCSSEETAMYKAALARRIISHRRKDYPGREAQRTQGETYPAIERIRGNQYDISTTNTRNGRVSDLTGGLGVDSAAFAGIAEEVMYNEMESSRADAARHNFSILGINNIRVSCLKASPEETRLWSELKSFSPDLIFVDPARRSSSGSKVFLLEECSPDILELLPRIFGCTDNLLLKLSPMADISMAVERLEKHGAAIREVHCIAADGECKELLIWASKPDGNKTAERQNKAGGWDLVVYDNGQSMTVPHDTESRSVPVLANDMESVSGMKYLFEPGKALAKAGLFNTICRYGLVKAGIHTHLYFSSEKPEEDGIAGLGKVFVIKEIIPLNRQNISKAGKDYQHCEVSARNIPMTSEELRKRLGVKSGGDIHIFGVRIDCLDSHAHVTKKLPCPSKSKEACLIITERLGKPTGSSKYPL